MELQPAGPSLRVDRLKPVSKARFSPECGDGCWEVGGPAEEFGSWDGTSSSSLVLRCPTVAIIMPTGSRKSPASSFPCILGSF